MKYAPRGASVEDRILHYGWSETETGCWVFGGSKNNGGYGILRINGGTSLVHRLAYELWVGAIPPKTVVRHICDNPPCINPKHLELGSQADNVRDMVIRKRQFTVMTPELEETAWKMYVDDDLSYHQIGGRLGIHEATVRRAIKVRLAKIYEMIRNRKEEN